MTKHKKLSNLNQQQCSKTKIMLSMTIQVDINFQQEPDSQYRIFPKECLTLFRLQSILIYLEASYSSIQCSTLAPVC